MVEIVNQILDFLVANYALYMVVTMSIIISLTISLITLIKKPIKKYITGKIKNEKVQKLANKFFVILAFAISGGVWVALHFLAPEYFAVDTIQILLTGAFSVVLYEMADGVVTKSKAKQIVDAISDFAETDEQPQKIKEAKAETKKETDPIKEFWKRVK